MSNLITKDFSRISFHDSSIEKIERSEKDSISITFDWAKLNNYSETGISDSIVVGKNTLFLTKISSEKYFKIIDGQREEIECPKSFAEEFALIGSNEFSKQGQENILCLGCFLQVPNDASFYEWEITFSKGVLSWNNHVTHKDWLNGKIPD